MAPEAASRPVPAEPIPAETAHREPEAPATEAPKKEELESIVSGVGLEWVETRPTQLSFDETPAPVARPQRQRKPRATPAPEPLMQVETRETD